MEENKFPTIDMEKTGKRLKEACDARHVTARELQGLLNLGTVQAVYHWFRGERLPSIDNFFAISKFLGVPLDRLLVEKEEHGQINLEQEWVNHYRRLLWYWEKLNQRMQGR